MTDPAEQRKADAMRVWREARKAFGPFHDYEHPAGDQAAAAVIERAIADAVEQERARAKADHYAQFTSGMQAAAEICGSLAETTYDDADGFKAATGCEAAIMAVVKQQRREQAAIERGDHKESKDG